MGQYVLMSGEKNYLSNVHIVVPMILLSLNSEVNHILTDSLHNGNWPTGVILLRNHPEVNVLGQHTSRKDPAVGGRGPSQDRRLLQCRIMNQHVIPCIITLMHFLHLKSNWFIDTANLPSVWNQFFNFCHVAKITVKLPKSLSNSLLTDRQTHEHDGIGWLSMPSKITFMSILYLRPHGAANIWP